MIHTHRIHEHFLCECCHCTLFLLCNQLHCFPLCPCLWSSLYGYNHKPGCFNIETLMQCPAWILSSIMGVHKHHLIHLILLSVALGAEFIHCVVVKQPQHIQREEAEKEMTASILMWGKMLPCSLWNMRHMGEHKGPRVPIVKLHIHDASCGWVYVCEYFMPLIYCSGGIRMLGGIWVECQEQRWLSKFTSLDTQSYVPCGVQWGGRKGIKINK